jgi:transposase
MEVVQTGRRRRWSDEEKLRILREASLPGARVRAVARCHAVAPSQIYDWRKKIFRSAAASSEPGFAEVVISPEDRASPWQGRMEVRCSNGRTITVGRDVDVAVMAQLVAALDR